MSRIFLSHSSKDLFEALALRGWLASEGWDDVFLDADPERGINPGERWERALHQAAQRCEAVVFLLSRNWLASGWCRKEYELARSLKKQLFGVLIDPEVKITDAAPELTGTWQIVSLVPGHDGRMFPVTLPGLHEERHVTFGLDGLRRLKRGLEKAGLDPKFFPWPPPAEPGRVPYRGLKPLEADDAGIFFGRAAPIVEATGKLRELAAAAAPRLLVILGASGAGKSSFLRAGLVPRLQRDDAHFLPLPPIRPGRAALTGEAGLVHALATIMPGRSRAEWKTLMGEGAAAIRPLLAGLAQEVFQRTLAEEQAAKPPAVVIAIDQAEELFRPAGAEEGAALLALLRELTTSDDPAVIVVFAIRSDSYDALEHAKPLEGLRQATLPLLPMPRGAYMDVIEGPVRRLAEAGRKLVIEPQLTQRLLTDIEHGGGSDALPLLAFTLEQLFLEYGGAGTLRLADYEAFGGLRGAIDAAVERAFARADADPRVPRDRAEREALLRRGLIPWLAGIDPESKSPRRAIARARDIPGEAMPLIELLVEERLLSTDTKLEIDPAMDKEVRTTTIEPAHEALLRQWGLLDGWLREDFGLLATLEAVQRASVDWDANGRAEAWLAHRGQRLAEAGALDKRVDLTAKLGTQDRLYLKACRAYEEARRAEAEKVAADREAAQARMLSDARALADANRRRTRAVAIGLCAALGLAGVALYLRNVASREAQTALNNQTSALAAFSSAALQNSPVLSVKLALAAWPRSANDRTPQLPETLSALSNAIPLVRERRVLHHRDVVTTAMFSADGTRVVTASFDATARIWDPVTGRLVATLTGHKDRVSSAAFSPDGKRVVTSSWDKTARVWDAATGQQTATMSGHQGRVSFVAFSPDGTRVVTASEDKTARVWDAVTGSQIALLEGQDNRVNTATFSPDGKHLVTASLEPKASVWEVATRRQIRLVVPSERGAIMSAAFSPEGARIVTVCADNTSIVWDATTGRQLVVLSGHEHSINRATFSADGTRVVTASYDKTARIWDAATGEQIAVLRHEDAVMSAAFSRDDERIITASRDKTARIWDVATGEELAVLRGHDAFVDDAAFSPDGSRAVTVSVDRTARIWDAATNRQSSTLEGHGEGLTSARFSPNGTRVVTSSWDNTARVWDVATGQTTAVLKGHTKMVHSADFSADGKRVVTASYDLTARIWDSVTAKELKTLTGHKDRVSSAAFSPDGTRVVTSSWDKTARVWDVATSKEIFQLEGSEGFVVGAAYAPDGKRIVTASFDATARIWDATTGRQSYVLRHREAVMSAEFSPDGSLVVTASTDHTAQIWNAKTGRRVWVLAGHGDAVMSAAFSADGTRVVTASRDWTVRVWDVATGTQLALIKVIKHGFADAEVSPDGTRIVTASDDDKAALLLDIAFVPKGNGFQVACSLLPDHDLSGVGHNYGLIGLAPVCESNPPLPATLEQAK